MIDHVDMNTIISRLFGGNNNMCSNNCLAYPPFAVGISLGQAESSYPVDPSTFVFHRLCCACFRVFALSLPPIPVSYER